MSGSGSPSRVGSASSCRVVIRAAWPSSAAAVQTTQAAHHLRPVCCCRLRLLLAPHAFHRSSAAQMLQATSSSNHRTACSEMAIVFRSCCRTLVGQAAMRHRRRQL